MTSRQGDQILPLAGVVDTLAHEFAGAFDRETVTEVLLDSLDRPGPVEVKTCRPLLAHRFARQWLADAAATSGLRPRTAPVVLFACTRNAGRSQLAAALLEHAAGGRVVVRSAGSEPADALHEEVVDALAEAGVHTAHAFPSPSRRGRSRPPTSS